MADPRRYFLIRRIMQTLNDLESDLALSVLVNQKNLEKLGSRDLLPLISRIREVLEPISERDHSQDDKGDRESGTAAL